MEIVFHVMEPQSDPIQGIDQTDGAVGLFDQSIEEEVDPTLEIIAFPHSVQTADVVVALIVEVTAET